VWLTTLPLSCADSLEIWDPQAPGNVRDCAGIALLCSAIASTGDISTISGQTTSQMSTAPRYCKAPNTASTESGIEAVMNMKHWWNDTER
jgi:hypothetical protein